MKVFTKKCLAFLAAGVMFASGEGAVVSKAYASGNGSSTHYQHDEKVYYFQDGDTLIKVCKKFYGTGDLWKALAVYNGITNTRNIQNGTPIFVPVDRNDLLQYAALNGYGQYSNPDQTQEVTQQNIAHFENGDRVYYFQDGDTLRRIAKRFYGDAELWKPLMKFNNIKDTRNIQNGTPIYLPEELEPLLNEDAFNEATSSKEQKETRNVEFLGYEDGCYLYKFKAKDTLWALAVRFYGDGHYWHEFAAFNGITNPRAVPTGMILRVPDSLNRLLESTDAVVNEVVEDVELDENNEATIIYVVKKGDTLAKICKKYYKTRDINIIRALAAYNNIKDINNIHTGTVLYLPSIEVLVGCVGYAQEERVLKKAM